MAGTLPPMRLVLAGRLSQKGKGQTGLDTQDEDARHWATEQGHTVVFAAADMISGRVPAFERPKLGPWLNDPKLIARYDGVLFSKMDRATRARDWSIRTWAEEHGKKLIIVSPELVWPPRKGDVATPIIWDDLVNIAAAEWENTSMRYERMQKALRDQAFFVGKKPYPYRIIPVEGTDHKTLEPDPERSTIAQRMADFYDVQGWSLRNICVWLTENGYPQPQMPKNENGEPVLGKGWTPQAVRRILRSPAMIGRIQANGHTYMTIKPIIPIEQYNRIKARMGAKAHRGERKDTALLTGIFICPNGHNMYRIQGRKIPSVPDGLYYYCRECPKGERQLLPLTEVDTAVNKAMSEDGEPYIVRTVIPGEDWSEEITQVRSEISALDPESDVYDAHLGRLRAELADYRNRPSKPSKEEVHTDGRTIGQAWDSLETTAERRSLLLVIGAKIWARRDDDEGFIRVMIGPDPDTFEGNDYYDSIAARGGPDYLSIWRGFANEAQAAIAELEQEHGFRINLDGTRTPLDGGTASYLWA